MKEIQDGDVVRLKSGGPKMTVNYIGSGQYICKWFSGEKLLEATFSGSQLKKAGW